VPLFCVSYQSTNKTLLPGDVYCNFLVNSQDEDPETSWMLLSEDDLVSLFSQFPFDELFKRLLGICSKGETCHIS